MLGEVWQGPGPPGDCEEAVDVGTEDEVNRLPGLGATRAGTDHGADRTWVVMADVEGNEFGVVRALAPRRDWRLSGGSWNSARDLRRI